MFYIKYFLLYIIGQINKQNPLENSKQETFLEAFKKKQLKMSTIQSHSLCNKFKKWINTAVSNNIVKCCQGNNCSKSQITQKGSYNQNNMFYSPYKKTSFQNLLRNYPKLQQEQNEQKISKDNNLKRSFESRVIKYDHIKSKINTNLNILKTLKEEAKLKQCVNKVNEYNQNIDIKKSMYKKIKLNDQNVNQQNIQFEENYKNLINDQNCQRKNQIKVNQHANDFNSLLFRLNSISKLVNHDHEESHHYTYQDQQDISQNPFRKNSFLFTDNKFTFSQNKDSYQNEDGSNFKEEQVLFSIDGYKIFQQNEDSQERNLYQNQQDVEKQRQNQISDQQQQILKNQMIIKINHCENDQNCLKNDQLLEGNIQNIKQTIEVDNISKQKQKQTHLFNEKEEIKSQGEQNHSNPMNQLEIIEKNDGFIFNNDDQKNKPEQITLEPSRPKPRQSRNKSIEQSKILTRSKQQKLHLFNKISIRLMRKKYGYQISHQQLAQKVIQNENQLNLKAFISHDLQDTARITIFDSKQLNAMLIKNLLVKYFVQEEKDMNLGKKQKQQQQ